MSQPAAKSRETAIRIIMEWLHTGTYPERLLSGVTVDRELVAEIAYGVSRWKRELEWLIQRYSKRPPSPEVAAALMAGFYQLRHTDGVPAYAAVNETVAAVRKMAPYAAGYVNRLLRQVQRDEAAIAHELASAPLGTRTSHPDLLVNRWIDRYGHEAAESLCIWNNTRPKSVLHVDATKIAFDAFLDILKSSGIAASPHPTRPDTCIVIPVGTQPSDLPGYAEGHFVVRDPSTSIAVELLDPQPGERVLDACAAPGGKTVMMAQMMEGRGEIVAVDTSTRRMERIRENIERMKLSCVTVCRADATSADAVREVAGDTPFDRILLDVPCTNTGVLRRRADARWRFSEVALQGAVQLQKRMLDTSATLLNPGGVLVYSTCSLEPEEGHDLIRDWLAGTDGFTLVSERTTFPPADMMDGAFAAAVRRDG